MDLTRLPDFFRYELMSLVPCFGITKRVLRSYRYQKKTLNIVRTLLDHTPLMEDICREVRAYDFLANPCFAYQTDGFHLVVYYRSLSLEEDYL
ncbi:MAG: hypothetical protein EBX37_18465, partial [Alphaproteobacteria bacterium]|nr:hypothetical protein [Alphaproteobacteria bacterium]